MCPQGKAKMGFYPCPPEIVQLVAQYLDWPATGRVWMIDPTCGMGEALAQLGEQVGPDEHGRSGRARSILYGVEMSVERADEARTRLDAVIGGTSCLNVLYGRQEQDVAWFNPPYDWNSTATIEELSIFNVLFLQRRLIRPGGLYIGILPRRHLRYMMAAHLRYLELCMCYKFPSPHYEKFGQVVFFGIARKTVLTHPPADAVVDAWVRWIESDQLPDLGTEPGELPDIEKCPITPGRYLIQSHLDIQSPKTMENQAFDVGRALATIRKNGPITQRQVWEEEHGSGELAVQVARTLSPGHLSQFLAGGVMNGLVLDGRRHGRSVYILKAVTTKTMKVVDRIEVGDQEQTISRTSVNARVVLLDLVSGDHTILRVTGKPELPEQEEEGDNE